VFARLFVVFLIETPDQLFKDCPHCMVVEAGMLHGAVAVLDGVGAEVDVRREEFFDQRAKCVRLGKARDLIAEFELLQDVLDIGREAVEVRLEIRLELLLAGASLEVAQREF